uniref:Uncharacterized protein n=1 Tax=Anguilla anguilla TaxID=7936 RepID=A0A0E9Q1F8_ANGAN
MTSFILSMCCIGVCIECSTEAIFWQYSY